MMKTRRWRMAAGLMAALLILSLLGSAFAYDRSDFEAYCKEKTKSIQAKSGMVLVTLNGERVVAYTFGRREAKGGEVTPDTCYRVASVTKFVTAVGLMTLYEKGAFELDRDVRRYLPFPITNPAYPYWPITPRQLLSHTSTFQKDQSFTTPEWERIVGKENAFYHDDYGPGQQYEYSNLNGAMFGSLIESLSGQSLNTYMRENVFDVLDINAAYHPYLLRDKSNLSDLYRADGDYQMLYQAEIDRFQNYHDVCDPRGNCGYSVGRMYISGSGLEKILLTLLNDGTWDGVKLLEPETVAMMEAEQKDIPGSTVTGVSRYGLGMEHLRGMPGGTWYGHQGRVGDFTCDAYYQKETGLTLVLILSGYHYQVTNSMVYTALEFMEEIEKLVN